MARFTCSWGPHVLDVSSYMERRGRDLLELLPASGPGGEVIDSGPARRQLQAVLQWLPTPEDTSALDRRDDFLTSIAAGKSLLLIHPLDGGVYLAKIGEHTEAVESATNAVIDNVTFVEDRASDFAPQPVGTGIEPSAGAQSVAVAASLVNAELAALTLESDEPDAAAALADDWAARSQATATVVDARRVQTERDQRLDGIDSEVERLELTTRTDRYQAYIALVSLSTALRRAAQAATQSTSVTRTETIGLPLSLRALAASIDAEKADVLYDGIRALNRIDTPLLIPAGTVLLIPVL